MAGLNEPWFRSAEIMVSPEESSKLKEFLDHNRILYTVKIQDVQQIGIENERRRKKREAINRGKPKTTNPRYELDWTNYHGHDVRGN